jgi:acyl-coenzyme A synthetase/AMP-(fatty) acid ligase
MIPAGRTAAIVFTSGSTGDPVPNPKPWAALVACSEAAAERFGLAEPAAAASMVGTVPPQHMYGFETTVLLPLHAAVSSYAGSTFFPRDVAEALARVPGRARSSPRPCSCVPCSRRPSRCLRWPR